MRSGALASGTMRLAILSDIHGNLVALEAVLADLRQRSPDGMINLGDCATAPLWPKETLELLHTMDMPTVRGNHDRWLTEGTDAQFSASERFTRDALSQAQISALHALPPVLHFESDITAVHGTASKDTEPLLETPTDGRLAPVAEPLLTARLGDAPEGLVLCGHSHLQRVVQGSGNRTVVNPGSVGCPRYADNPEPWLAEPSSPHARYAIATRVKQAWSIELFALVYDWHLVVARARAVGREDWGRAFLGQARPPAAESM